MDSVEGKVLQITNDSESYKCVINCMAMEWEWADFRNYIVYDIMDCMGIGYLNSTIDNSLVTKEIFSHYSGEVFGEYIPSYNVKNFIDNGYKVRQEVNAPNQPDYSSIEYRNMVEAAHRAGRVIEYSSDTTDWKVHHTPSFHWDNSVNSLYRIKPDVDDSSPTHAEIKELANVLDSANVPQQDRLIHPKEKQMNPSDIINTRTFVMGNNDTTGMTDDELFGHINTVSKEIQRLEEGNCDSKKMQAKITEMKDQLAQLVKFVDER